MAVDGARETPYADEIRFIWRLALSVFVITIGIGLVNSQRVSQIDPAAERPILLTHLHTGTVGWITLGLFAAAIWMFTAGRTESEAGGARALARFGAVAVACYPITFFLFYPGGVLSNAALLGVFGTLALAAIVWLLVWLLGQSRRVYMSVARLAVLGAVLNLTLGAVLGVLIEARFAGIAVPGNVNTAHPAMMTIGYVLPAAFAFVEWRLGAGLDGPRSRAGTIAVALLIVGGWLSVAASLMNLFALFPAILLFQIVATVIFAIRMWPRAFGALGAGAQGERHVAITALAIPIDVALLVYAVIVYLAPGLEPPRELFIAIGHTEFVGMMTNALFATVLLGTALRREAVWPWADTVVFWGMNVGWVGFALVELMGARGLVAVFAPIMGLSLLLGVVAYALRLRTGDDAVAVPVGAGGS